MCLWQRDREGGVIHKYLSEMKDVSVDVCLWQIERSDDREISLRDEGCKSGCVSLTDRER